MFFKPIHDLDEKIKVKIILLQKIYKNSLRIIRIHKRAQIKSLTSIFVAKKSIFSR